MAESSNPSTVAAGPSAAKKRRIPIKDSQRKALRGWYNDDSNGQQSLDSCGHWWKGEYGYFLNSSSCSEILSKKFSYLDDGLIPSFKDKSRANNAHWMVLEEALFEWQQRYEASHNTLTGEILRLKAVEFWRRLPVYQGLPIPKFSTGWLDGFKARHGIRQRNKHGEAGSADRSEHTAEIMAGIREVTQSSDLDDIYNMDETGYFWKMIPDRSLGTERESGQKAEKARITALLTCNATGSRKLPIWYIGKAARPLCFRSANIEGLESLGAVWRNNTTAWMVHGIMKEYLRWFDSLMERPSLLLMDNFSAHELGCETFCGKSATEELRWTTVIWLPPNATSLHQPLDQGIIQNWKTHIRRQFVRFMVEEFDAGKDPKASMNVLRAIRWGISAWENDVKAITIRNCWIRSQCYDWSGSVSSGDQWSDSKELMTPIVNDLVVMERQGQIRERMNIESFLNPIIEEVYDQEEDVFEAVIARYGEEREAESDEEVEEVHQVSISEALSALKILQTHEEQQKLGDSALTKALRKHERELQLRKTTVLRQGNLGSWLGAK